MTDPSATAAPVPGRPDRRIAVLLAVALAATGLIVGFVWLTKPPGGAIVPDTIARGQPVPNIAGTALDGSKVDLASLRVIPW